MWYLPSLVGIALLGWVAGMLTHRASRNWCPECGNTRRCVNPLCGFGTGTSRRVHR